MKMILPILLLSASLIACDRNGSDSLDVTEKEIVGTRWCAGDGDNDGSIGTYIFNENGTGWFDGWNGNINQYYMHAEIRWKLEGNRLSWSWADQPEAYKRTYELRGVSTRSGTKVMNVKALSVEEYGDVTDLDGDNEEMMSCNHLPATEI